MNKIKTEQLKKITDQQQHLTQLLSNIGVLEVQKQNVLEEVKKASIEIEKTKKELEEEYGQVNINLENGEIIRPGKNE